MKSWVPNLKIRQVYQVVYSTWNKQVQNLTLYSSLFFQNCLSNLTRFPEVQKYYKVKTTLNTRADTDIMVYKILGLKTTLSAFQADNQKKEQVNFASMLAICKTGKASSFYWQYNCYNKNTDPVKHLNM